MPKFNIVLTRTVSQSLVVEVEACDEEAAVEYLDKATPEEIESCAAAGWEVDGDQAALRDAGQWYIACVDGT